MINQLQQVVLMVSALLVLGVGPAWAQTVEKKTANVPSIREVKLPLTSAEMLVQLPTPSNPADPGSDRGGEIVPITSVKANPTSKGVEVILETPVGTQLQVTNRSTGNNFIVDISGGQLRLPSGEAFTFRSDKPLAGITEITVININANTVRVTVVGEKTLPTVELFDDDAGLVFAVASTATATSPQPPSQTPQASQPENQTQPTQPSTSGDEPIELVVTGQQDTYNSSNASTATKTDTPLRDIPQSIQVIPREVIQDQGAVRLNEIVRNVSGVATSNNNGNTTEFYTIRGFAANIYKNGFPDIFGSVSRDSANIERVEVLKGPASVLFGRLEPSGIINLITKKPLAEPYYNLSFTAGSYSFYRPTLDFSSPLTADGKLGYRLNIAYENAGSFRDFVHTEKFFIAPVLSWKIGDNTNLTFEGEYQHLESPYDRGLIAIGGKIADVPISRYLSDPRNLATTDASKSYLTLNHDFNQNLSLRTAFRVTTSQYTFNRFVLQGLFAPSDGETLNLLNTPLSIYRESYYLQNDLTAKFNTGFVKHTLLFGLELGKETEWRLNETGPAQSINIFNPVYNFSYGPTRVTQRSTTNIESLGLYLQDQIAVFDNLKLLVGGRFDTYRSETLNFLNSSTTQTDSDAFTPRVGIVYQPTKEISLFANYSRSFVPVSGTDKNDNPFEPTRGTGYEVGIKGDFFNGRLSSTLSFYNVTKTNVLTTDPSNINFSIQVGEQRARGIELDVAGEILPGWKVIASYSYIDGEVTKDNFYPVGNALANTPQHSGSLWTTYTFQKGALEGFGFGAGIFASTETYADYDNVTSVPGYIRTDAALFYKKDRLRASVNFKNLFSTRYFETAAFDTAYPAAPFTVQGTISWDF